MPRMLSREGEPVPVEVDCRAVIPGRPVLEGAGVDLRSAGAPAATELADGERSACAEADRAPKAGSSTDTASAAQSPREPAAKGPDCFGQGGWEAIGCDSKLDRRRGERAARTIILHTRHQFRAGHSVPICFPLKSSGYR